MLTGLSRAFNSDGVGLESCFEESLTRHNRFASLLACSGAFGFVCVTPSIRMADIESLKQALAVSRDNVPLLLMLGEAHMDAFSLEDAQGIFEQVLAIEPANPMARLQSAQLLDLRGRSSEATLRLEQLNAEQPVFAAGWFLRAWLALSEGDSKGAREFYDKAVALDAALASDDLLKRIREAGGRREQAPPSNPEPQRGGSNQAGAFF